MSAQYLALLAFVCAGLAQELCPGGIPCLRKCCPIGHSLNMTKCLPGGHDLEAPDGVKVVHARPLCDLFHLKPDEEHTIHHNGTADFGGENQEYCRELNHLNETHTYLCFPPEEELLEEETPSDVYRFGVFISIPFLFATFIVHAAIKRLRAYLHGQCIIMHSFSMTVAYTFLGTIQFKLIEDYTFCVLFGYAIQFFFMATFFWLNVMCFDIYWAFSGLKHLTGSVKERERKKLILYSCYAWGLPLLILLVTIGIDYSPYVPNDSIFKPGIGVDKCFFQKDQATGIYFYMPMGCVLVINIVLFSITAYRIFTLRRETAVLKRGDSRKHDNTNDKESVNDQGQNFLENKTTSSTVSEVMIEGHKDPYIVKNIRFSLYLKLFLVMGINWVMELLSYLAGGPSYIWYIPDFTNTLQGVFIFIIFVWKERVRKLIWAKMSACCGCKTVSNRSRNDWATSTRNTSTHTSSSGINTSIKMTPTVTNGTTTNQTMTA